MEAPYQQQQHAGTASTATDVQVMDLTADSLLERQKHEQLLLDVEAKKRATMVDVPTLPQDVRNALRALNLPVRLFGENLAHVRDRLRMALAKQEIYKEQQQLAAAVPTAAVVAAAKKKEEEEEEEEVTKYTRASSELIEARQAIAEFSLNRSKARLELEQKRRTYGSSLQQQQRAAAARQLSSTSSKVIVPMDDTAAVDDDDDDAVEFKRLDEERIKLHKSIRKHMTLQGSQYGDTRALSAICTSTVFAAPSIIEPPPPLIATGGWSGDVKLWDGSSPQLDLLGNMPKGHEDRITGIAMMQQSVEPTKNQKTIVATASIDLTAKLWNIQKRNDDDEVMEDADNPASEQQQTTSSHYTIQEAAHLQGHQARLCQVAFHPMHSHVGTTSFDHTWRLWDVTTGKQLLLQDGHWKETYGIGFHPDGSLCATTDFGGVVQVWDLRTGKSVCHFLGHAKRVLCAEFSPNGYQLASAGDDGTIRVWDLRRRKQFANIPAHSKLIGHVCFARTEGAEFLASCSFDGTAKIWSTRDWKMLSTLRGHEGKVMGIDVLGHGGIVTCGYDKTLKYWR